VKFLVDAQLPRNNRSLEALLRHALPKVEHAFQSGGFVELGRDRLAVRA
jgi:predicted nuclease of predicted toxin-antitoxin system